MSNKKSIEIYFLTEEREKRLWENCIFVFDTSAILKLYYYSKLILDDISKSIFSNLESQERLWIPQRVEYEFFKNREDKIETIKKTSIQKSVSWCEKYKIPHNKFSDKTNIFLPINKEIIDSESI